MGLIFSVKPLEDYHLLIALNNGHTIVLSLVKKLGTCRFSALADKPLFQDVTTDGTYVLWHNGSVRLGISEIFEMVMVDNILHPEE